MPLTTTPLSSEMHTVMLCGNSFAPHIAVLLKTIGSNRSSCCRSLTDNIEEYEIRASFSD
jgi:hypothetical protein